MKHPIKMKPGSWRAELRHSIMAMSLAGALTVLTGCGGGDEQQEEWAIMAVVAEAGTQPVKETLSLVANLEARDAIQVISEVSAPVEKIHFEDGQTVSTGELLITLDGDKLKARLDEAEAAFALAKTDYDRNEALLASDTISRQEYDQAESQFETAKAQVDLAKEEMSDAKIVAPFDGAVTERLVSPGQFVSNGEHLTTLIRFDPLEAEFDVPERHLASLARGQEIVFQSAAYPGRSFEGTISYIAPEVDRASRTLRVKAELPNPEAALKPGMFGQLDLVLAERDDAVVIPEQAVQFKGEAASVYAVNAESRAEFRPVKVGLFLDGQTEIIEGLQPGDRVITEGFQKVFPGVLIQPSGEAPPAPAAEDSPAEPVSE